MAKLISPHSVLVSSQFRESDCFKPNYFEIDSVHNQYIQQTPPISKLLLFVDTGLFPTQSPTRTLGVMEQERWIHLPLELIQQSLEKQIQTVSAIIITHYEKNLKGLPLWGDIQRYCLYTISEKDAITKIWFDVDGSLLQF